MKKFAVILILLIVGTLLSCPKPAGSPSKAWVVSTLAGSGTEGSTDDTGASARFSFPTGVAVDSSGNLYVADQHIHRIRKIEPNGETTTIAGGGDRTGFADGLGPSARFNFPTAVALDSSGNVYVADTNNNRIRKITLGSEVSVSTLTTNTGTTAEFSTPKGVAVDSEGNVYVAAERIHRIHRITDEGVVSLFAGSSQGSANGRGTSAQFSTPQGMAVDASGNLYVADHYNHLIRKITPEGVVSTLAGTAGTKGDRDGAGTSKALFHYPSDVAVDAEGNVYVADRNNHRRIRKITAAGVVSTLAGSTEGYQDGVGASAQFDYPNGVAVDAEGNVYVADASNRRIRKIEYKVPD